MKLIDPSNRTVTLKLPRWMVCRVLVMLSAMQKNYMLVDEDGRMKRLPENLIGSALCGQRILGTILIVGQKEDLLTDVPSKYFALLAIDMV